MGSGNLLLIYKPSKSRIQLESALDGHLELSSGQTEILLKELDYV